MATLNKEKAKESINVFKELYQEGIISEKEFNTKKEEILNLLSQVSLNQGVGYFLLLFIWFGCINYHMKYLLGPISQLFITVDVFCVRSGYVLYLFDQILNRLKYRNFCWRP